MRPTIPLDQWRIAVDLRATQSVQNQEGLPAVGCTCKSCANWSHVWKAAFSDSIREQLERLQIDVAHPSELYAFEEASGGAHTRVIFHVVGKLLSGPNAWREDENAGTSLVYHSVSEARFATGLVVVPSTQTFNPRPRTLKNTEEDLLQIDFRLFVPSSRTELHVSRQRDEA
jgi:hypothetical protein